MESPRGTDPPPAEPEQAAKPSLAPFWSFLGAGSLTIAVYYAMPAGPTSSFVYEGIGLAAALAILWARHRYQPSHGLAWTLIATGVLLTVLGDITWAIYEWGLKEYPEGSLADVFYLAAYPFLAAGVLKMVSTKIKVKDRDALIDAGLFTLGFGLVTWQLIIQPASSQPDMSTFAMASAIAYPLGDVLLLAVMLRLLLVPGSRVPAYWLMFGGLALTLIADELYAQGSFGRILDPLWLGSYVLLAAAALHPSMGRLTQTGSERRSALGLLQLVLLVITLVSSVAVLIPGEPDPAAILATLIFALLVLARVALIGRTADRVWKDQQANQALLREAAVMYRSLVERLPAVTYLEAPDDTAPFGYRDTYVSPQVNDIFGISTDEWMTDSHRWRNSLHPDDRERVLAIMDETTEGHGSYKVDYRVVPRSGEVRWVRDEAFRLHGADGQVIGWQGIAYDITDEKAAEQAIVAREVAERANEEKSAFLSRVSHELRTPLNAILGFCQLLEMDDLSAAQKEDVAQILSGGHHLLELVNELLEVGGIEAGQRRPSIEPVLLGPLVTNVLDLMTPVAAGSGISLRQDTSPPDLCVRADEQTLRQVLLNLVSNGIKYNREGGRVNVSWTNSGDTTSLRVSDTGLGIPEDKISLLWVPFERLGAEEAGIVGTGLGLTLALRQVQSMGASLTVESEPGFGSTFTIQLPAAEHPTDRVEALLPAVPVPDHSLTANALPPQALSILCIEDNPANLLLVEKIVERRARTSLVTAVQGGIGLQLAREHTPDVIMLDLHLPDIPGEECLRTLQDDPRTREIPVIIVTADARESVRESLTADGAAHFISKPIDIEEFLGLLDEIQERLPVAP